MTETWNKKEREKKKRQKKTEKAEKKQERKESGENPGNMIAYLDENGNLSSTPPDPRKKVIIKAEDIELGIPRYDPANAGDVTRNGVITFFNHDKGFGFIKDLQTQESVFVHINALSGDAVNENDKVTFEIEMGPRGSNAINVKIVK